LARKLSDLGLPIERTSKGWELGHLPQTVIEKFSRRTAQIEEKARELGINSPEAKAALGATTRERKAKELTMSQLREHWKSRLSSDEFSALSQVAACLGGDASLADEREATRAVDYAANHLFERRSVVAERELLATALRQAVGQATPEQVHRQFERAGFLVSERNGRRMVTTHDVLGEEQRIIDFARNGRGTCKPFVNGDYRCKREWLNASQQNAVRHILGSRDRVVMMLGAPGVGKTSLMKEAVDAIEHSGTQVVPLAPSADASRTNLREAGFTNADTVARFLVDQQMQEAAKGGLLWIDEASMLGAKTMVDLFAVAEQIEARILLTGDTRQHGSIARGAMLQLLERDAGVKPAHVKEIQRQSGKYKAAIKALSEGKLSEGFARLDDLGWIREVPDAERYKQIAAEYVRILNTGDKVLILSPSHAECDHCTHEVRKLLKENGKLASEELTFTVLDNAHLTEAERRDANNYSPGDVIQFHQNAKGFTRGDRLMVNSASLPLDQAERFSLFHRRTIRLAEGDVIRVTHNGLTADGEHRLDNGSIYKIKKFDSQGNIVLENNYRVSKNFGHIAYGYAGTSYSAQSKTTDHVLIAQSSVSFPASSQEQWMVSTSRGAKSATVFCDDRAALRAAVAEKDERVTATELLNGSRQRQLVAMQERYHDGIIQQLSINREERTYER
jgi:hypothetical protein